MKTHGLRPLFDENAIRRRVDDLARQIDACYGSEPLVMICVLKGACIFFSDLVRRLACRPVLDFVALSSYGNRMCSGGVTLDKDVSVDLQDRHVLVVEDIVDTGHSMRRLFSHLRAFQPRSLRLVALIDKHERREVPVEADFYGFRVTDGFIVGYGLDYAEQYRELPALYTLPPT
ncbi:MAG: hypoxanthine phosphoribosyltransferase [Deltaproteobacteria bacterium]|jgi:hypoxanthine phosphoribosyltransferase|nr:hypoxanthine phosphoribosyltransferase [Deltaproteobacteria bacterium]